MDRPKRTISKPTRYVTTSSDEAPPSKQEKITNPPISTSLQMNKDIDELKRIATEEDNGNTLDNVTDYNNLQNNNPEIRNDDLPLRTYTNTHKSCMNTQQYTNTQPYTTSQLSYSSIQPSNESHSIIQAQPNTHTHLIIILFTASAMLFHRRHIRHPNITICPIHKQLLIRLLSFRISHKEYGVNQTNSTHQRISILEFLCRVGQKKL